MTEPQPNPRPRSTAVSAAAVLAVLVGLGVGIAIGSSSKSSPGRSSTSALAPTISLPAGSAVVTAAHLDAVVPTLRAPAQTKHSSPAASQPSTLSATPTPTPTPSPTPSHSEPPAEQAHKEEGGT